MIACSGPGDCEQIERERATGIGLLVDGGSSRGNLLSGEAEEAILTVSRMSAEKRANPGYRAFFANGFNVTRDARPLHLGARARVDGGAPRGTPRRAPARPPQRPLSVDARGALRRRPRPDRLRRPHRHDARPPGRLRDVLELRRGRAPLRASSAPTPSRRFASSTSSSDGSTARAGMRLART